MPNKMTVDRDQNRPAFLFVSARVGGSSTLGKSTQVSLSSSDVLHIPGLGFDGLIGYSPIAMAKNAIGLAIATEEYGAKFFANGAAPAGVLEHPGTIKGPDTGEGKLERGVSEAVRILTRSPCSKRA